eukprot:c4698_g1_i1.p1 GENE.c4698_g1_i1~~c4698_g1_i1.p1  ORF type:complete len:177 (-),score=22.38 c4698_g1_i1:62-565(-)
MASSQAEYFSKLQNKITSYQLLNQPRLSLVENSQSANPVVSAYSDRFKRKVQAVNQANGRPRGISQHYQVDQPHPSTFLLQPMLSTSAGQLTYDEPSPITFNKAMSEPSSTPIQSNFMPRRTDLTREERISLLKNRKRAQEDNYRATSNSLSSNLAAARTISIADVA